MKVAVVEDNVEIRTMLKHVLENHGHVVLPLAPSDRLFQKSTWNGAQVALIDLNLEEDFTGLDVLRWLKAEMPHIKRLVGTAAYSVDAETRELADAPVLFKAYDIVDLEKALTE